MITLNSGGSYIQDATSHKQHFLKKDFSKDQQQQAPVDSARATI